MRNRHLQIFMSITVFLGMNFYAQEYKNLPPAQPQNIKARRGLGRALLSWTPNKESDLHGYNIYFQTDQGGYQKINKEIFKSDEQYKISYYIVDLKSKSSWKFRVTAVDRTGNESKPAEIHIDLMKRGYPMAGLYWPISTGDLKNSRRSKYLSSQTGKVKEIKKGVNRDILIGPTKKWFNKEDWVKTNALISSNSDVIYYTFDYQGVRQALAMADSTGKIIWKWDDLGKKEYFTSRPVLTRDGQIIFSTEHRLQCLGYDGFYNWHHYYNAKNRHGSQQDLNNANIVIDDSSFIYVGVLAGLGYVYKFDSQGKLIWEISGWIKQQISQPDWASQMRMMILDDGDLIVGHLSIACISNTGQLKWSRRFSSKSAIECCLLNDGNIFASTGTHYYILSAETGDILHNTPSGYGTRTGSSQPLAGGDDTIYLVRHAQYVHALTPYLQEKWMYDCGSPRLGDPVIDFNGLLYVPQIDGSAIVFQIGD